MIENREASDARRYAARASGCAEYAPMGNAFPAPIENDDAAFFDGERLVARAVDRLPAAADVERVVRCRKPEGVQADICSKLDGGHAFLAGVDPRQHPRTGRRVTAVEVFKRCVDLSPGGGDRSWTGKGHSSVKRFEIE